jgi:hypothetical protein
VTSDPGNLASSLWDYTVNEKRGQSEGGIDERRLRRGEEEAALPVMLHL